MSGSETSDQSVPGTYDMDMAVRCERVLPGHGIRRLDPAGTEEVVAWLDHVDPDGYTVTIGLAGDRVLLGRVPRDPEQIEVVYDAEEHPQVVTTVVSHEAPPEVLALLWAVPA